MSGHNLSLHISPVRISNAVAAGTSTVTSSALDMLDYDGVLFVISLGAITATSVTVAKVQQSSDDGSADDYTDLAGTATVTPTPSTDDNKVLLIDIYKPAKRYLKAVVTRTTANCVIDGILAIRYHGHVQPAALDATVKALEVFNQPAEGTA